MAITDEVLNELLKEYQKPEDLLGKNGLLKQLQKRLLEKAMGAELTVHLGYEKHATAGKNSGNSRNGTSPKRISGEFGNLDLAAPRDRNGSFEPQIVAKGQRRFEGFDQAIISLYSRGMTTREIEGHLLEIYGVKQCGPALRAAPDVLLVRPFGGGAGGLRDRGAAAARGWLLLDGLAVRQRKPLPRRAQFLDLGGGDPRGGRLAGLQRGRGDLPRRPGPGRRRGCRRRRLAGRPGGLRLLPHLSRRAPPLAGGLLALEDAQRADAADFGELAVGQCPLVDLEGGLAAVGGVREHVMDRERPARRYPVRPAVVVPLGCGIGVPAVDEQHAQWCPPQLGHLDGAADDRDDVVLKASPHKRRTQPGQRVDQPGPGVNQPRIVVLPARLVLLRAPGDGRW